MSETAFNYSPLPPRKSSATAPWSEPDRDIVSEDRIKAPQVLVEAGCSDEVEIARLSTLSAVEYDREREEAAKSLGIRVGTLDEEVLRRRAQQGPTGADQGGTAPLFPEIEPWPERVDGEKLLSEMVAEFNRFVVLRDGAAEAIAFWVMFTHAHDCFAISPLLALTSPTPECGKTTTLSLLNALVPRPLSSSNVTAAVVFRAVEKWSPTLIIDEGDTFLRDNNELPDHFRGVLTV